MCGKLIKLETFYIVCHLQFFIRNVMLKCCEALSPLSLHTIFILLCIALAGTILFRKFHHLKRDLKFKNNIFTHTVRFQLDLQFKNVIHDKKAFKLVVFKCCSKKFKLDKQQNGFKFCVSIFFLTSSFLNETNQIEDELKEYCPSSGLS